MFPKLDARVEGNAALLDRHDIAFLTAMSYDCSASANTWSHTHLALSKICERQRAANATGRPKHDSAVLITGPVLAW